MLLVFALDRRARGSAFVIANTFTILVAQRVRELALLRCVGGSRAQVLRSVLLEAAVVGLCGGAVGLGLGFGLAYALFGGANALGAALPSHPLVLTAAPVAVALLVGVLVTMGAALVPAVRAGRVPPLAALRLVPATRVGTRRGRIVLCLGAGLLVCLGAGLTVSGERSVDPHGGTLQVVAGGVLAFFAVVALSPLYVARLITLVGWLPGRLFGTPARLAARTPAAIRGGPRPPPPR